MMLLHNQIVLRVHIDKTVGEISGKRISALPPLFETEHYIHFQVSISQGKIVM